MVPSGQPAERDRPQLEKPEDSGAEGKERRDAPERSPERLPHRLRAWIRDSAHREGSLASDDDVDVADVGRFDRLVGGSGRRSRSLPLPP